MASLCLPTEVELVYRDVEGGVTLLNAENLTTRVLMTNSTFVSNTYFIKRLVRKQLLVAQCSSEDGKLSLPNTTMAQILHCNSIRTYTN
jgi:hypothetical protein